MMMQFGTNDLERKVDRNASMQEMQHNNVMKRLEWVEQELARVKAACISGPRAMQELAYPDDRREPNVKRSG